MCDFIFSKKYPKRLICSLLADRIREIHYGRKISKKKMSEKSGVSLGVVKRFENSGEILLKLLTKIAVALEMARKLEQLFEDAPYLSIEEKIDENN